MKELMKENKMFYLMVHMGGFVWTLESKSDCFMKSMLTQKKLFINFKGARDYYAAV